MTNEKIIANIERYISTVSKEQQQHFEQALEIAEKEHKPVKKYFSAVSEPIFELAEIVQELKREIKEKAQKETNSNSFVKRSKLITKLLSKCWQEKFQKGFFEEIDGAKKQCCIIDGYYAFAFNDELDIPMLAENEKAQFTLKNVLPEYKDFEVIDFDIAEIKTTLKLHKAKKDKNDCVIELNGKYYNAEYFINVVDGLGGNVKLYQNSNKMEVDICTSENGLAVLCPMRKPENI